MGIGDPMRLSLGEWVTIVGAWNKAHGGAKASPPSEDEFDRAVLAARGVA